MSAAGLPVPNGTFAMNDWESSSPSREHTAAMLLSDRCPSQVSITRCGVRAFTVPDEQVDQPAVLHERLLGPIPGAEDCDVVVGRLLDC
jgi:hypothetical protein